MPTGVVTVSQYSPQPAIQVDANSVFEVRGWYTASFIAGDGVTPLLGNSTSGEQGPYILVDSHLNASGYLVVPAHDVQATTLSNPTANYFEGLWIDGAFTQMLMPNNNVGTGWQIPTIYGSVIAIDEIALYNRAKRLLFPPDTFPTFEDVILLIRRLAGNFDYAAVGVNGITSMSAPPVLASLPIAVSDTDHRIVGPVYNVDQSPYDAAGNGVTDDSAEIQAALDAAGLTGGVVVLPSDSYNIGTASVGLTVPSNVILMAPSYKDQPNLLYGGSGVAVDTKGSFYVGLVNLYVQMTNGSATGFRWGNHSVWCWAENLTASGTNSSLNIGTGFDFDARGSGGVFSSQFYGRSMYSVGNKYGISVEGTNAGNETWTGINLTNVTLIGRLDIPGSVGIKTDTHSNLEGSVINGIFIEAFLTVFDWGDAASCFGFTVLNMGNEGNGETIPTFPFSWAGWVADPHNTGYYQRSSSFDLTSLWDREKRLQGEWITESINRRIHVIYDGSQAALRWGFQRGGSVIGGEIARDKFVVSSGSQFSSSYVTNYAKLLEYKIAFNTAAPTDSSWGVGSPIFNSAPGLGLPTGWVCTASGTFKTALAGVTGTATINTRTLVVNSVSTMEVGNYISIVGVVGVSPVTSTFLIVGISGTTLTLDNEANASVAGAAVQYVTPTFQANDNLGTARSARATSPFDVTSNVALADVPGLSVMVEAGFAYTFKVYAYTLSNIAGGVKCAIGGTFTASSFRADALVFDSNTVAGPSRTTSKGSAVGAVTAVTAATVQITGTIAVSVSGTLTLQFSQNASNVAASSVLIGSSLEVQLIG